MRIIAIILLITGVITILGGMQMPIYRMAIDESLDVTYVIGSDIIISFGIAILIIGVVLRHKSKITHSLK